MLYKGPGAAQGFEVSAFSDVEGKIDGRYEWRPQTVNDSVRSTANAFDRALTQ